MKSLNNNAYKNQAYVSPVVKKRNQSHLKVVKASEQNVPSDKEMTLGEKILMNILVWGGFEVLVWTVATGDWWM
jgi:uncharacterized ion transporter superfamily protein YfcC